MPKKEVIISKVMLDPEIRGDQCHMEAHLWRIPTSSGATERYEVVFIRSATSQHDSYAEAKLVFDAIFDAPPDIEH